MKKISSIFLLIIFLAACSGGGSSGTGTVSIQGSLKTTNGQPIASAQVNVAGEIEQVTTDSNGVFVLNVAAVEGVDGIIALEIESMGKTNTVNVQTDALASSNITINVEIKLDPNDKLIVVNQVDVEAKIVGACDLYFENLSTIRQSNEAPQGVNCILKVSIKGDGKPLSDVPFVLEYTGCSESREWKLLAAGETRSAPVPGDGQLGFEFFDNSEKCVYRIIAPYQLPGVASVITKIHTFTKQEYDKPRIVTAHVL